MADDALPAPSSLMSRRWSRDNLVTCHPAQLYNGTVREHIDEDALELLIRDLEKQTGPVYVGAGRMGVHLQDVPKARRGLIPSIRQRLALPDS